MALYSLPNGPVSRRKALRLALCGLAVCLCSLWAMTARAGTLRLDVPEQVARGDAFLALAVADTPMREAVFSWRGKPCAPGPKRS